MESDKYIKRLKVAMGYKYPPEYIEQCLIYAQKLLDKNLPVIFNGNHCKEILKLNKIKLDCYHVFRISGKNKEREITAPSQVIKWRQQWILTEILEKITVSDCCHGFVKNRSILTNAKMHMGRKNILNLDIKDFFPSITQDMVMNEFQKMGYSESAARVLSEVCCYEGRLPQGAPTSPYMSNLILYNMDNELIEFCEKEGVTYTRYADDMSFSSNEDIGDCVKIISEIVEKYSFKINEKKTSYFQDPYRKMVTGLLVKENEICIPKKFKRRLKQEIYYCKQFGVQEHLENTGNSERVGFKEYMYGKAYYVAMVEPEVGRAFLEELDGIDWGY